MRYATEDVEVGGETVRRGEAVMPSLVAANYDPRMFGDPRRLDITRVPDGRRETHVAFSHGMHYCLGAALARQEGEVAFEALLRRFPGLSGRRRRRPRTRPEPGRLAPQGAARETLNAPPGADQSSSSSRLLGTGLPQWLLSRMTRANVTLACQPCREQDSIHATVGQIRPG
ncbi:cytochrome P450 [Streptosporangium lutulentum]